MTALDVHNVVRVIHHQRPQMLAGRALPYRVDTHSCTDISSLAKLWPGLYEVGFGGNQVQYAETYCTHNFP